MSANVRQLKRRPAKRPEQRTVTVHGKGEYTEWEATARADFPAGLLADLQSGQVGKIIGVLDVIVIDHNFPNGKDEIAETMGDVDPYDGLMNLGLEIFDALAKLPNR